jgi:hypothetical protein
MTALTLVGCYGQPTTGKSEPPSKSASTKHGVSVSFVRTDVKSGKESWRDEDRPFRCVVLRITNNTRWTMGSIGLGNVWCYRLLRDSPERPSAHPKVPCGSCGDVRGPVSIAPRQNALICIAPEDLAPGYGISIRYTAGLQDSDGELYFGHSDLPPNVQLRIAQAALKPCEDLNDPVAVPIGQLSGPTPQPANEDFTVTNKVCCASSFALDRILKSTTLSIPPPGSMKLMIARDRSWDQVGFGSTSETRWSGHKELFLNYFPHLPPVAYVLVAHRGAAAVLWDPRTGRYESRNIRGRNPLILSNESEIVHLRAEWSDATVGASLVHVWVWTKTLLDRRRALEIFAEAEKELRMRIRLTVGTNPLFWEVGGSGFPIVVPAFGALGRTGLQDALPAIVFNCNRSREGGVPWCGEVHPE